jgi:hypothetical protein
MGDVVMLVPNKRDDIGTCGSCEFGHFLPDSPAAGECRFNPPVPLPFPQQRVGLDGKMQLTMSVNSVFPPVAADTFCHCFEDNDAEKGDGDSQSH